MVGAISKCEPIPPGRQGSGTSALHSVEDQESTTNSWKWSVLEVVREWLGPSRG